MTNIARLSDVLKITSKGKLGLNAQAKLTTARGPNPKHSKHNNAVGPDAPFDFKYDSVSKKYGAGTAFLKDSSSNKTASLPAVRDSRFADLFGAKTETTQGGSAMPSNSEDTHTP